MGTVERITKVLEKVAIDNNYLNYNIEVKQISSGGANYSSTLYNATIKESENVHHMFVKVAISGEKLRADAPNIYKTEIFVYTELMDIYKRLENDLEVPEEHRLILSKYYGCNATLYQEILVLENLVTKGYQAYDRFQSVTWEYATSAFKNLAKWHALSFAYSEYHPEEFGKVLVDRKFEWGMEMFLEFFRTSSLKAIETVQGTTKEKLRKFCEIFGVHKFHDFYATTRKPVLTHGDFRPSNLMHKINDDGTVDIKVCDLQTVQGGSPVVDIIYFIFTGSDEQFRAQYYDKLLDYYYTELCSSMKRLQLNPETVYSRADFEYDLKEKLPFGLTIAVFSLPIITMAVEDAPEVNDDMDLSTLAVDKNPSNLYVERLNGVINDYIKFEITITITIGLAIAVFILPIITVAVEDAPEVNEEMDMSSLAVDRPNELYVERLNGVVKDYIKFGPLKE